jgi:hypothetical protein
MVNRGLGDKTSVTEDLVEDDPVALERDFVDTVTVGSVTSSNASEAMTLFGFIEDDEVTGVL